MKENKKIKQRGEKGSVTLYVLVSMLFFMGVLILSYTRQVDKINNQRRQIEAIQKTYEVEEKIEEVYQEQKSKMQGSSLN